eukprot:ctg_586.g304
MAQLPICAFAHLGGVGVGGADHLARAAGGGVVGARSGQRSGSAATGGAELSGRGAPVCAGVSAVRHRAADQYSGVAAHSLHSAATVYRFDAAVDADGGRAHLLLDVGGVSAGLCPVSPVRRHHLPHRCRGGDSAGRPERLAATGGAGAARPAQASVWRRGRGPGARLPNVLDDRIAGRPAAGDHHLRGAGDEHRAGVFANRRLHTAGGGKAADAAVALHRRDAEQHAVSADRPDVGIPESGKPVVARHTVDYPRRHRHYGAIAGGFGGATAGGGGRLGATLPAVAAATFQRAVSRGHHRGDRLGWPTRWCVHRAGAGGARLAGCDRRGRQRPERFRPDHLPAHVRVRGVVYRGAGPAVWSIHSRGVSEEPQGGRAQGATQACSRQGTGDGRGARVAGPAAAATSWGAGAGS